MFEISGKHWTPTAISKEKNHRLIYFIRLTLFYPLSAILTIFCYIISNPTAPEAHSDLDVIKQVGEQIRDLGEEEGKLSGDPTEAERVWKVIMALEGLARRAVDRVSSCPQ